MVTEWIVSQVARLAPSPFSGEAQELIGRYAPPDSEADRQFNELALVTGHALLVIPVVGLWGLLGWVLSGGHRPSDALVRVGWGALVVLFAGIGLHLIRYYDAYVGRVGGRGRGKPRTDLRWPRASGDLDFVVQFAVGLLAVVLGAPA